MNKQIIIYGHYGYKNTGDDAMLYILLKELYEIYPDYKFVIISPIVISVPPEIKSLIRFIKLSPFAVISEIMHSRIFLLGGGTHFHDLGNKIKPLRISFERYIIFLIARFFCDKVYLLGIGIEPINTFIGYFIIRQTIKLADFISVRDSLSYEIIKKMGLNNKSIKSFDLTALLPPTVFRSSSIDINKRILGISILPFFEIYYNDSKRDFFMINEIAKGLNYWLQCDSQNYIFLFIFKGKSIEDDVQITQMLQKKLTPPNRVVLISYSSNPQHMFYKVSQCSAFIGMRYHACMFAYLNDVPMLIISYFEKCRALAEDIGLSEDSIISIQKIMDGHFEKCIHNLYDHPENFRSKLPIIEAKKMARYNFMIELYEEK